MGAMTGAGTRTRIEMKVEVRDSLGTNEVAIDEGRKTRGGATPASNQRPQWQDPTPQQDRRTMQRTRSQGREARDRIREGRGEAMKRKKPPNEL